MTLLAGIYERNKRWLWFAVCSVFLWGLAAHGYAFFNNSFSHDSLNEFNAAAFGNVHKIMLGRFVVPTYRQLLRCDLTMPWLIGLLSLLWTGLAVFFVLRAFRVESRLVAALIAGVFVANSSFSATAATYIHDLDCNMFAVLCAAMAIWLWRSVPWGWLPGAVLIAGTLGIYQSIVFVAVALAMMACILDILDGHRFAQVMCAGLKAIGMILIGGIGYYLVLQLQLYRSGLTMYSNGFNSLDTMTLLTLENIPALLGEMYRLFFARLWNVPSVYSAGLLRGATVLLVLVSFLALGVGLCGKQVCLLSRVLCLILIGLLPLGTMLVYILSAGYIHELMLYAVWLVWLLPLLLCDWLAKRWQSGKLRYAGEGQQLLCLLLTLLILYGNVQFANTMYLKKDIEYDSYMALMSRVVGKMEAVEDYVPGQTPVTFVGLPADTLNQTVPGFESQAAIVGMEKGDGIFLPERSRYRAYFNYVLNVPLLLTEYEVWNETIQSEWAAQLPCYPEEGFAVMHDGALVVKLGPA